MAAFEGMRAVLDALGVHTIDPSRWFVLRIGASDYAIRAPSLEPPFFQCCRLTAKILLPSASPSKPSCIFWAVGGALLSLAPKIVFEVGFPPIRGRWWVWVHPFAEEKKNGENGKTKFPTLLDRIFARPISPDWYAHAQRIYPKQHTLKVG